MHVVLFSGGAGSWAAAKRIAPRSESLRLLFCDTLIEDDDLYRFLVDAAADVFGVSPPSLDFTLPSLDSMDARRDALRSLRDAVTAALPSLVWLIEGRSPWEVFQDVRFIGNSRIDPCSKLLKRELSRQWLEANCDPAGTEVVVGIDAGEKHRFDEIDRRQTALGWTYSAPLCDYPMMGKVGVMQQLRASGLRLPRLYQMGFVHNNCGGFCVKAGQDSFRRLLEEAPERYAYHERQEAEMRRLTGKDVSVMTCRRGGTRKPLTMLEFRKRLSVEGRCEPDEGSCNCFLAPE